MKSKLFTTILFFCVGALTFAQSIQFISSKTGDPLSKVSVFNKNGDLLTSSDIEGKISKDELLPIQDSYILVYEGYTIANLKNSDFDAEIIKLTDRITSIDAVIIQKKGKAKYIYVRGNFNVYMTVNKQLNVYADGIATYIFDNSTKKLKSAKIEQYRSFLKEAKDSDRKKVATTVFQSFLELPNLEDSGKMNDAKYREKNHFKEIETTDKTKMQVFEKFLQEKDFGIFGYRFFDFQYLKDIEYTKSSKNLKDLVGYSQRMFFKLKHKSEPEFNQLIGYSNFIPSEISFGDNDNLPKIKLNPKQSFYHYEYWKAKGFPNMQPTFANFFKDSLEEQPNSAKK